MIICNCLMDNEKLGYCILKNDFVFPLNDVLGIDIDHIQEIIENWDEILKEIHKSIDQMVGFPIEKITFLSPIPKPVRNIICVGKNYLDHAKELEGLTAELTGVPLEPIYFSKMAYETIGDGDPVKIDQNLSTELDYEVELAVVIKRKVKNLTEDEVQDAIFGYVIFNDYTLRDLQKKHIQWHKGKSVDTLSAFGPYIVTAEEIAFPPKLEIVCKVNGECRQMGMTDALIFPIAKILTDFSKGTTLIPGDVIATGTPSGVGMGFKPPKYLKDGDVVESIISRLGHMKNTVVIKN